MGLLRSRGLGAVSLWSLVRLRKQLGVVAGSCRRLPGLLPGLVACLCLFLRFRRGWLRSWLWLRIRTFRLDAVWTRRLVPSVVRRIWGAVQLRRRREFQQLS